MFVELPGSTQLTANKWHGVSVNRGYRSPGHPPILVWHTVEGVVGKSYISGHNYPPHLWWDPINQTDYQTMSLGSAARALQGASKMGIETNNRGICIQVELQLYSDPKKRGTARHVASLTDEQLDWIAGRVAAVDQIVRGIDPQGRGVIPEDLDNIPELGYGDSGYGYGDEWEWDKQRWYNHQGFCGHGNAPGQTHYDPTGEFDMRAVAVKAAAMVKGGRIPRTEPVLVGHGTTGAQAREVQRLLNYVFDARLAADGIFGTLSVRELTEAQELLGVPPTGKVTKTLLNQIGEIAMRQRAGTMERPYKNRVKDPVRQTPTPPAPTVPAAAKPVPTPVVVDVSTAIERAKKANNEVAIALSDAAAASA